VDKLLTDYDLLSQIKDKEMSRRATAEPITSAKLMTKQASIENANKDLLMSNAV
jgi:hypothetical protein